MKEPVQAFPLQWPAGWRRAVTRERAKFGKKIATFFDRQTSTGNFERARGMDRNEPLSIGEATKRVLETLSRMGISDWNVVISSNLELRQDGLPRSGQRAPLDPGCAVYWQNKKEQRCIAVDRYDRVQDNLAAIAATLEAMRAIERHGGAAILDRAFQGFTALAAPIAWWQTLGLTGPTVTREEIEHAYRRKAMEHHPDRKPEGEQLAAAEMMMKINTARDQGLEAL